MIRAAAPIDPDIEALWRRIQTDFHANQRAIVESLAEKGALDPASTSTAPPTSSGRSTTPTVWQLLVGERGWTPEEYEQWCVETACAQLIPAKRR